MAFPVTASNPFQREEAEDLPHHCHGLSSPLHSESSTLASITSPASPSVNLLDMTGKNASTKANVVDVCATDILSPEIVAIAVSFAAMRDMLSSLNKSLDLLDGHTEKMVCLSTDIKFASQVELLRAEIEEQISKQEAEVAELRATLEAKVKEALANRLRARAYEMIKDSVSQRIEDKVRSELTKQMPDDLPERIKSNQRDTLKIKVDLHNSEARLYNGSIESASLTVPLRPLLRPLPTPEQSPAYVIRTLSTASSAYHTPLSAYPYVPMPTPITNPTAGLLAPQAPGPRATQLLYHASPTPSPLFPRDLKSLFALGPEAARALLRDYGLNSSISASAAPSPSTERPSVRDRPRLTLTIERPPSMSSTGSDEDLNTFMAHIGVPFLIVPAPIPKGATANSSSEKDRKLLPPLVIGNSL